MMRPLITALALAGLATASAPAQTPNPDQPARYLGDVILVAFNYCPSGWAKADGRLLPIAQNQPLFSVIGTAYGGNRTTDFALPDLRGRIPVGRNGRSIAIGDRLGQPATRLSAANLPAHSHRLYAAPGDNNVTSPNGHSLTLITSLNAQAYVTPVFGNMMNFGLHTIGPGNTNTQPFPVYSPTLNLTYCVALTGNY